MKCLPLLPVLLLPFVAGCELFLYSGEETPRPCPPFEGFSAEEPSPRSRFIINDGSCQLFDYPGIWGPFCAHLRYDSIFSKTFCTTDGAEITIVISGDNKCPGPDQDLKIDSIYLSYQGAIYNDLLTDTIFSSWCQYRSGLPSVLSVEFSARLRDPFRDTVVWLHDGIAVFALMK